MKIVCVNNSGSKLLIGKTYIVISENKTCYIINESGFEISYLKYRFRLLDEIRDEKLKLIGIV